MRAAILDGLSIRVRLWLLATLAAAGALAVGVAGAIGIGILTSAMHELTH